jgi:hypothetical protein
VSGGIEVRIDESQTGRIVARLDQFPKELRARLKDVIAQLTHQLLEKVQAAEPVRTGTLRQQTHAYLDEGPTWIRGRVRALRGQNNLGARFGALEYGAPGAKRRGMVKVRAYRRDGATIRAYLRHQPHIKAMRFLRGPAAAQLPRARALIRRAIGDLLQEENKPT